MKIELIQTSTVFQTLNGKSCKECEEEEAQAKLREQSRLEEDRVSISGGSPLEEKTAQDSAEGGLENNEKGERSAAASPAGPRAEKNLSQEERQVLTELKTRDREVRAHEQAHLAAAGPYAKGPPSFEYQTGPDGKRYAVGGEVQIDTSRVSGNPQATLIKAQTIKRAATAPANPSAQDRQVAAQAARLEAEARREIQEQRKEKLEEAKESGPSGIAGSPSASVQESQSTSAASEPARESGSHSLIQNRLEKSFAVATEEKGRLLDIVS